MKGAANPSRARPHHEPQETVRRDSAAMEELVPEHFSTHLRHGTTEVSIQQSEHIVLDANMPRPFISYPGNKNVHPPPFFIISRPPVCAGNCHISSRKINHRGALLCALILYPHVQDSLFIHNNKYDEYIST